MNRDEFFTRLPEYHNETMLSDVQNAYWIAKRAHSKKSRRSGGRYFDHPRRVALSLMDLDIYDSHVLVLALLHDVIEDTDVPPGGQDGLVQSYVQSWSWASVNPPRVYVG